jgi:hypothetical protein
MRKGDTDAVKSLTTELKDINAVTQKQRDQFNAWGKKVSTRDTNDTNYIFLSFVKTYLPAGLKGLLIAIIAAWGSIAAALNSLGCKYGGRFPPAVLLRRAQLPTNTPYRNGIPLGGGCFAFW